ncbi:CDP-diacylglycerol--serine O-phosphatidyltransferase [Microaerobacter geothermalis]|uniref:CDP-diacylglycerol--serine O-phosphatidyltransferase n=1 Tax=Microaerobacter geothermalis TaxID=674972 RepID=UPI001F27BF56|nr:CDP-diacylglycerol--serine O-phosphatidyltransferase [Microaerobacter geothermalis]MCF6094175.1 CDP-diacylglycerol--serine O-phosphatidyltransferase [Microaerobacter geothermalis]
MDVGKSIPNLFTLSNLTSGVLSLTFIMNGFFKAAGFLILLAAFFDMFDGRIARKLNVQTEFGVHLDSLADMISFGVAPGLLVHSMIGGGFWTTVILILFPITGALRLARFNTNPTRGYFVGVPITFAGGLTGLLAIFGFSSVILSLLLSVLMVSTIRFPKI